MIKRFSFSIWRKSELDQPISTGPAEPALEQPKATPPLSVMELNFALFRIGMQAPSVIAMRTLGAAGWWNSADSENAIMIREKQEAFAKGVAKASLALWQGASPAAIMLEAVKPVQAKTGSNVKRLTKKGPRIPGSSR